jgi:archaellum biogenesis ATPase FlaH
MSDRLLTRISSLDRQLEGGLPAGSLVVLSAPPASQSEQFLRDLTAARRTLVLTTRRRKADVQRSLGRNGPAPEHVTVHDVSGGAPLERVFGILDSLSAEANVIVDPLDPLERTDRDRFVAFLNALSRRMRETGSLAFLHCLDGREVPPNRDVTEYIADVIFDLTVQVRGDSIENRLVISKFRNGVPFEKALKLEVSERIAVDTSRQIG